MHARLVCANLYTMPSSFYSATKALTQILENKLIISEAISNTHIDEASLAKIKAILYGTTREYFYLKHILGTLIKKPLPKKSLEIEQLLLIAIHQLLKTKTPSYAIVNNAVDTCKQLQQNWATKLVNAVLRNLIRQNIKYNEELAIKFSHPQWLNERFKSAWGKDAKKIIQANHSHPPLHLRVNLGKISRDDYFHMLQAHNISAVKSKLSDYCVTIEEPIPVKDIPKFSQGFVSVQDTAAQQTVVLLNLNENLTVLDACAAPGGKSCHILETEANLKKLVCADISKIRLDLLTQNLQRLGLSADVLCKDIMQLPNIFPTQHFDRILLDAPCSATGVIRRHPEIKLLRKPQDIKHLATQQLKYLKTLWPLLKPNGIFIYATCSILPEENDEIIEKFCQTDTSNEIKIETLHFDEGKKTKHGWQFLPEKNSCDGFYFSKILKNT